jgi:exopolysaccharide production protein ExoY
MALNVLSLAPVPAPRQGSSWRTYFSYRGLPKRAFDIVLVVLSLPVALPVILVLMAIVARDGHSPIYRQPRIGRGGRIYKLLKIRTMLPDAEARLAEHLAADAAARAEWQSRQKLRHDPRITAVGRLLRKSSLDELPQLWNVLVGDMSLVGPRPMMVDQRALYPGRSYAQLRPGITGPWQVSERNESTFAERARYDDAYLSGLSFAGDVGLLWRTVAVVLRGTGC